MRLLYFAPVPYQSYWQRPHYMVRALLACTYEQVIWIDPPPTRLPRWSDLARLADLGQPGEQQAGEALLPRLTVLRPGGLPLEPLPLLNRYNDWISWRSIKRTLRALQIDQRWDIGVGRPSRLAGWAVRTLPVRARFMDVMDDFPAFYRGLSRLAMQRAEADLVRRCDYLFCSQPTLAAKLARSAPAAPIRLIPNGYDMARLPPWSQRQPGPAVIGFVGTLAAWFDWPLVIEMAQALPAVTVRLIGPRAGHIPAGLPRNIELLPACPVEQAIRHCQEFTVGLIPFLDNALTRSVDPIKYYELTALGVPIWSSSFGSMAQRLGQDGVAQIRRGSDWAALWRQASQPAPQPGALARFRAEHDWAARFGALPQQLGLPDRASR